jgi:multicomponent Na+:H+ antiporter subunit E
VVVPLRVQTDGAITTIANSITLTPGTITMDYDEETNALYVHSIDATDMDDIVDPIRTWEDYALVIFDEEGKPGDPVPELPMAHASGEPAEGGVKGGN